MCVSCSFRHYANLEHLKTVRVPKKLRRMFGRWIRRGQLPYCVRHGNEIVFKQITGLRSMRML